MTSPKTYRFIARTAGWDRNGLLTEMDGWELANYHRNPVVLFNHSFDKPVGRSARTFIEGQVMYADIELADTPLANELRGLLEAGFIRAASVGYTPITWRFDREAPGGLGIHSSRQDLFEISLTPVGADPNALHLTAALAQEQQAPGHLWNFNPDHYMQNARADDASAQLAALAEALANLNQALRS